ncbi:MAG TPA: glycosyltransferase family 39 protein [Rhizomicrobium sp.]|nr:glycosyltransferase family 39 protein [Rhizomicrobium sp.]
MRDLLFRPFPRWTGLALVVIAAGVLTVLFQARLGAYSAELGYDECSHYVSGLFIHDYLASGLFHSPIKFLRDFGSSYPLVGIGHWGPFWYGVEALWMFLFGWSLTAMMAFSALTTVVIAALIYRAAAKPLGGLLAGFAALAFVCSPITQVSSAAIMLDGAITLICLLAALSWQRYTRTLDYRYALAFGALASAGLLTKGNAGCLALVPPFFLLLDRNWSILKRWSFWLPVGMVLLIAGPWSVISYHQVSQGFRYGWGWPYISVAVPQNAGILVRAFGPLLLPFVLLGAVPLFRRGDDNVRALSALAAILLSAVLIFQCVAPAAIQDRYLEPALPPLFLLAAIGIWQLFERSVLRIGIAGLVAVAALPWITTAMVKRQFDLKQAVAQIWQHRLPDNPSVLIVSDGGAEGAAVAEIAMHDKARPSLFAVRGSRLLGGGGYNSQEYQPRFKDPRQALRAIDQYGIPLVLIRRESGRDEWAHVAQIDQARSLEPLRWRVLYRKNTPTTSVTLYQIAGNDTRRLDENQLKQLTGPRALQSSQAHLRHTAGTLGARVSQLNF